LLRSHLTGKHAQAVVTTWIAFALHANSCPDECGAVAVRCRTLGLHSNVYPPMLSEVCPDGRLLFEAWRYSVDELKSLRSRETQQESMPA
jgi:hypothetical protein